MKNIFLVCLLLALSSSWAMASGNLKEGRYLGYIEMEGRKEKIALEGNFYLSSPEDFTQFPKLNLILKLSLGGYNTTEYMAQNYEDIHYDYDNAILNLDEEANDLVINSSVELKAGRLFLEGKIWSRSQALNGTLYLEYQTDEPDDKINDEAATPFVPLLDGQYLGTCKGEQTVFQIQTAKGLRANPSIEGRQLFDYQIVARLGYRQPITDPNFPRPWSVRADFSGGSFNFYQGKLIFLGPSTTSIVCDLNQGDLSCSYRVQGGSTSCHFTKEKEGMVISPPKYFSRSFNLQPTKDQLLPLPSVLPPSNKELSAVLSGMFNGYLHNESNNTYQAVSLHVIPSSSTANPHNPNNLFVSTNATLYFGSTGQKDVKTFRYGAQSFFLRPGFMLAAVGTDSFIIIEEWMNGYIRGTWYSRSFGKVGTIQMIKAPLPSLSSNASLVPRWSGEFEDVIYNDNRGKINHWFKMLIPSTISGSKDGAIDFVGSYQTLTTLTTIQPLEVGKYDIYTGALAWVFSANEGVTLVSGRVQSDGSLLMYWPPTPHLFMTWMGDYRPSLFKPSGTN